MGESQPAALPVALYGIVLFMAAVAYTILVQALIVLHGRQSILGTAIGRNLKGKLSLICYAAAIPLSFLSAWLAWALYVTVAIIWLIPDKRIERVLAQ
jgi:uncharacterized membrane protein